VQLVLYWWFHLCKSPNDEDKRFVASAIGSSNADFILIIDDTNKITVYGLLEYLP